MTFRTWSPTSPAAAAGLKIGDTITSIDGKPVKTGDELVDLIANSKPGTKVQVGYMRNGQKDETTVTVASRSKLFGKQLGLEDASRATSRNRSRANSASLWTT